jgi:hypothetical protein
MRAIRGLVLALGLAAAPAAPLPAQAYGDGTPDGSPPAEEQVCEEAGLMGAAFGLCVAYCEANDCDLDPDAQACARLRANYAKITGELFFPCEGDVEDPEDPPDPT